MQLSVLNIVLPRGVQHVAVLQMTRVAAALLASATCIENKTREHRELKIHPQTAIIWWCYRRIQNSVEQPNAKQISSWSSCCAACVCNKFEKDPLWLFTWTYPRCLTITSIMLRECLLNKLTSWWVCRRKFKQLIAVFSLTYWAI
jgi:hypothetical protein